jgi:hypothetical protein
MTQIGHANCEMRMPKSLDAGHVCATETEEQDTERR